MSLSHVNYFTSNFSILYFTIHIPQVWTGLGLHFTVAVVSRMMNSHISLAFPLVFLHPASLNFFSQCPPFLCNFVCLLSFQSLINIVSLVHKNFDHTEMGFKLMIWICCKA